MLVFWARRWVFGEWGRWDWCVIGAKSQGLEVISALYTSAFVGERGHILVVYMSNSEFMKIPRDERTLN